MSVTVSQVFAAYAADASASSQAIEDTSANILANIESVKILVGAENLTSLKISGTANTATLAQIATIRATFPGLDKTTTAKLVVTDSAANILAAGNATALALATTVTLTGANLGLSVSQSVSLAGKPNFSVGAGASLGVSDTSDNILSSGNSAGVGKATVVTLTGQSNSVTVAQSLLLTARPGFSLATDATLEVKGSAAELLLATNATGVAKATKVTLTGTSNTLNAANATLLVAKKGFDYAGTGSPTLEINDSAANLVASTASAAVEKATTVKITGENTITAVQAATLNDKITTATGATLVVVGTAAEILAVPSPDIGKATSLNVTGTVTVAQAEAIATLSKPLLTATSLTISDTAANITTAAIASGVSASDGVKLAGTFIISTTVPTTAAQAKSLASLNNYLLKAGTSLTITDTAANLVLAANATGVAKASAFVVTGTTTAEEAKLLAAKTNYALASGTSLVVTDTAANLVLIANLAGVNKANSIKVTGTATAAEAKTLAGFKNFVPSATSTLEVADTAANLLLAANSTGVAKATKVTVTGANTGLTAANLAALVAKPNFNVTGTSLEVSDTSANLLSSTNVASLSRATKVTMTNSATVTAAQATTLAALPTFTKSGTLTIADSAANILTATAVSTVLSAITTAKLTGTANVVTVANAAALKLLGAKYTRDTAAALTISDTATNLLAGSTAGSLTVGTAIKLTGASNTVNVAEAATLKGLTGFALDTGARLVVADTAANLLPVLGSGTTAELAAKKAGIAAATAITLTATGAPYTLSAADATALAAKAGFTKATGATIIVSDSAANLLLATNATGVAKADSYVITGTANTVTAEQLVAWTTKGVALGTGPTATLTVADTATKLISLAGTTTAKNYPTTWTLTGTANTVTTAQAVTLTGKLEFNRAAGATLFVTGSKTELLALNDTPVALTGIGSTRSTTLTVASSAGLVAGMAITGTGIAANTTIASIVDATRITLSAAPSTTITAGTPAVAKSIAGIVGTSGSKALTVTSSTGLVAGMAITGTGIPANATIASVVDATHITLSAAATGAISSGTATATRQLSGASSAISTTLDVASSTGLLAGMAITGTGIPTGTTIASVVNGTQITLSAPPTDLVTAANAQKSLTQTYATSIQMTGATTATAAEAAVLAGLGTNKFSLAPGATLLVSDTKANLFDAANASGVAKATTVKLSGNANTATAAEATTLAGKPNFAREADATLVIADTAANILAATNFKGVGIGTAFTLTGSNLLNAANAKLLAAKPGFTLDTAATMYISDTAANLLTLSSTFLTDAKATVQLLGTTNTVTAAEATTLAGATRFSFSPGALLTIQDTAANLMDPDNLTGRGKATTVKVTGESAAVTALQAKTLAALPNFSVNDGATLPVTDTAANLLLSTNATGVAKATTVKLKNPDGSANVVSVAELNLLLARPNFAFDADSTTLTVADNAANLKTLAATTTAKNIPTAWKLTGTLNSLNVADASALYLKPGFGLSTSNDRLEIVDTAVNLLTVNAASELLKLASGVVTKVTLSGTENAINVAEAKTLKSMTGFNRPTGVNLTVSGSSADLLDATTSTVNGVTVSNALGVALASTVKLTGAANTVTTTQLADLNTLSVVVNPGATLAVADTAAAILAFSDAALSKATTVRVIEPTDSTTNTVTAAQATRLAGMKNISVSSLELKDTAANIVLAGNTTGRNRSTSVTLIDPTDSSTNTVDAAKGLLLVATKPFSKGSASLVFQDTATNLLSNANSLVLTAANSVKLTGTANSVTVAESVILKSKALTKSTDAAVTLTVSGSKTDLLNATTSVVNGATVSNADGVALANAVKLTGANSASASEAKALAALGGGNFTLNTSPAATLVVTGNLLTDRTDADNLLNSANAAGLAKATTVKLSGTSNTGNAADAAALALLNVTRASGATLEITDTAANLLSSPTSAVLAAGVSLATTVKLSNANIVSVEQLKTLAGLPNFALTGTLTVRDTASAILGATTFMTLVTGFDVTGTTSTFLATGLSNITGYTSGNSTALTISDTATNLVASLGSNGMALASSFVVNDEATTEAQATAIKAHADGAKWTTTNLVITDTAQNLLAGTPANGLSNAQSVKLVGTSNEVTAAKATTLAGLAGGAFTVPFGATLVLKDTATAILANATTAAGRAVATAFDVSVDPANSNAPATVTAAQAQALSLLSNFELKTGTTMTVEDTASNLTDDANADGVALANKFKFTGTATALQAKELLALPRFSLAATTTLDIADSAANILLGSNGLTVAAADSVTLAGTGNIVNVANAALLKAKPSFTVDDGLGTLPNSGNAATLVIKDTAANILSADAATQALATSFDVSQATVSAGQAKDLELLTKFGTNALMTVEDSATNILDAANADGVALATNFKITGTVLAADATAFQALSVHALAPNTTLKVADSAVNILDGDNATGVAAAYSVTLTGTSNSLSVADAALLQAKSRFTLDTGSGTLPNSGSAATLVIADTVDNILATPSAVVSATAFDVSTDTLILASDARRLAALPNFVRETGTDMVVSDTAANLLMSTNTAGIAMATDVKLTGTSNTVTADQAATLKGKPGFVLDTGATLLVSDTAANIIAGYALSASTNGVKEATKFQVKGTASITQANTLAGWHDLGTTTGTAGDFTASPANGLVIEGSASDLINNSNAGVGLAAAFKVTGATNATDATALAALSNFAIASGTTLAITDTATNILASGNSNGVAKADSFSVQGTVDAATATLLGALMNFKLTRSPTDSSVVTGVLVVEDTATHLLDIANATGVGLSTTVTLSGTDNAVTAVEAKTLKSLAGFNRPDGVTLTVSGTKDQLLSTTTSVINGATVSNAMGVALATTVKLTGANTADAATAKLLASKANFSVDIANSATLVVTDTAANLLDETTGVITVGSDTFSNFTGVGEATSVHILTGTNNTVTAAQAQALKDLSAVRDGNATLVLVDTATNLLSLNYATGLVPTSVKLKAGTTNAASADVAKQLAALPLFDREDATATLVVTDTAANLLLTANRDGVLKASTVELATGANSVNAADATFLANRPNFAKIGGATLTVTDTAEQLLLPANLNGVGIASTVKLTGLSNTVSTADYTTLRAMNGFTLDGDSTVTTLTVTGSASALLALGASPLTSAAPLANATVTKITGGTNSVSVAQAAALATMGAVVAEDGSLTVSDSYANMIVGGNPATFAPGMALAKAIKLTGANSMSATAAKYLAAQAGGDVSRATGATLVVTDTAANLLDTTQWVVNAAPVQINGVDVTNATGVALASTVTLSGLTNTVSVAEATALKLLSGFTVPTGSTLVVADTAANLISNLNTNLSIATKFKLAANATATAAQATLLKGNAKLDATTFVVSDTAANLLLPANSLAVAAASQVKLINPASPGANSVSAAQALALSKLPTISLDSGSNTNYNSNSGVAASLIVCDSAANLLLAANAAGLAVASNVKMTGTTNSVTAAQAASLYALGANKFEVDIGTLATMVVTDTAANLLAAGEAPMDNATSVKISGNANTVTAAQALTLSGMTGMGLVAGASLIVSDSSTNLLASANSAGVALATTVMLSGTNNPVSATQAAELAAKPGFTLAAGATLVVSGTTQALLSSTNAAGVGKATSITVTGGDAILAAQAALMAAKPGFSVNGTMTVADSAANLLLAANTAGVAKATSVRLKGTNNTVTAAVATTLAGMASGDFALNSVADTLVVADGADNLLRATNSTGVGKATTVQLTGTTNTITAADALTLVNKPNFGLATGATLIVADTAANLLSVDNTKPVITGVNKATTVQLAGVNTSVSAADAVTLRSMPNFLLGAASILTINDSLANIKLKLPDLEAAAVKGQISSINLTDRTLSLTDTQYFATTNLRGKINSASKANLALSLTIGGTSTNLNNASDVLLANVSSVSASDASSAVTLDLSKQTEALTIIGGASADVIKGGAVADVITGGASADLLTGGAGVNTYDYTTLSDSLITGYDTITDFKTADKIKLDHAIASADFYIPTTATAASGNLTFDLSTVLSTTNFVANGAAFVTLTGTGGGRYLVLNDGEDGFSAATDSVVKIVFASPTATLDSTNLSLEMTSASGAQSITGSAGADTFYGFVGADTIDGGLGTDTIVLTETSTDLNTAGLDNARLVSVEAIDASLATAGVTITLSAQTEGFTITGGTGADTLTGGSGADNIVAGSGNDTINGFVGADTVDGGAGTDTLALTATALTVNPTTDAQLVNVEAVSAAGLTADATINLSSQKEAFSITGGSGDDTLTGGSGNDTFVGFYGADAVTGGAGTDTIVLAATSADLNAAADADIVGVEAINASATTSGVEINLALQTTTTEGFSITGGSGDDSLTGGSGNDTFIGFVGDDIITGGAGTADTIVLTGTSADLNAAADDQIATVEAINASTTTAGVEINLALQTTEGFAITGGSGADEITGGSGADSVSGGDGNDTIKGFVGADTIDGGAGTDTLVLSADSATLTSALDGQLVNVEAIDASLTTSGLTINLATQTSEGFSITGGSGDDIITGASGADIISAGGGDDTINGFVGADTIVGGGGDDTIVLTTAAMATALGTAALTDARLVSVEAIDASAITGAVISLTGQTEGFSITGGAGNDVITGASGADSISGGAGDDTINGFVGADTLVGGDGADTIKLTATSTDLNAAADSKIAGIEVVSAATATAGVVINLSAQTEAFTLLGGGGADTLTGGSDADSINGGAGIDTINGFVGADTVNGGDGADTIVLTATSDAINAATNGQIVNVEAVSAATATAGVLINLALQTTATEGFSITGGSGADTVTGGSGNDSISGGAGADKINGFVGADTVNGGDGADTLVLTGTMATALSTAAATDARLVGVETIDASAITGVTITLTGQTEGFTIIGGAGADSLTGGAGSDTFMGFDGADTLTGGNGSDTLVLTTSSAAALSNPGDARLVSVEAINAASLTAAVTINLTSQTEGFAITGGSGADRFTGARGADNIIAGAGDDTINGFVGADTVNGGGGTDTLVLAATSSDLNTAGATDARLSGVEVIDASQVAGGVTITLSGQTEGFTITGGAGADLLTGGAGNDSISGGAGADKIYGFAGVDTVDGGGEVDTLVMTTTSTTLNSATDTLLVNVEAVSAATATAAVLIDLSLQSDGFTLTGSAGADSLTGSSAADTINGGAGNDKIYGFAGADTVDGGLGTDTLFLAATSTDFDTAAANNARLVGVEIVSAASAAAGVRINLAAQTEAFSIIGGLGADSITGGTAADNINAGAGDDTINGFVAADTVNGGDGVDTIVLGATSADLNTAGATDARLAGVEAIDASSNTTGVIITMSGQTEGFSLTGGSGVDTITGGSGADSISGGAGDDRINGFIGADTVNGGDGVDTIVLTATSLTLNGASNAQLVNVEAITAGVATTAFSISVTSQSEGFSLTGGGLADTLTGGAGNDTLKGGLGADSLTGGLGVNTYDYANLKDSLLTGYDTIADFKATDKIAYATTGSAGAFNTASRASSGNVATDITAALNSTNFVASGATLVTLTGSGGGQYLVLNDAIAAFSAAADTVVKIVGTAPVAANISVAVTGTANADTLLGGAGADTISAGAGADTIKGGAGADVLTGGLGVNTFDYTTFTDSLVNGFDTITDFQSTDKIKLANAVASGNFKTASLTGTGNLGSDLSTALTSTNFIAAGATLVTVSGTGAGQYLVMNDATAAFNSSTDAVVKIVGSAVTSSNMTV